MTLQKPHETYMEDLYRFEWPEAGVEIIAERFQEERADIRCELTVNSSHPTEGGQLYFGRLLLMGPRARSDVVRALERRDHETDWGGMLEQVCTLALRRYREGEPAIDLWTADLGQASRYLVKPFVFDDALNLVYGSGDSGKSLLTLAIALAVASGEEVAGMVPERTGAVLYLDWEDSAYTHQERLRGLSAGAAVTPPPHGIIYRRMDASLKESLREIRKDVAKFKCVFCIVDSIGMACGGDPSEATSIIQTMIAARMIGIPVLGIHHIAKDAKDKSTPYGSVYASNEARMSWFVQSEREDGQLTSVLTNYKSNRGARHERQSFRFTFKENDQEEIERIDIRPLSFGESKTVGDNGTKWRIADWLKVNGPAKSVDIAEGLNTDPEKKVTRNAVSQALTRGRGTLFVELAGHVWSLGDMSRDTGDTGVFLSPEARSGGDVTGGVFIDPVTTQPLVELDDENPW